MIRRARAGRTGVSRIGASLVLLASLVQPAWGLVPRHALDAEAEGCCCPRAQVEAGGCCETPVSNRVPALARTSEPDCGCRVLPAEERPVPAAPAAADLTRELIRRHHHAAELSWHAPSAHGKLGAGTSDGIALAAGRMNGPPAVRTAPARSLGERGVARWLAFLSIARI